jgi:hypothetical protein
MSVLLNLIIMERLRSWALGELDDRDNPPPGAQERIDPGSRPRIEAQVAECASETDYKGLDVGRLTDPELLALERLIRSGGGFWDWALVERAVARLHQDSADQQPDL